MKVKTQECKNAVDRTDQARHSLPEKVQILQCGRGRQSHDTNLERQDMKEPFCANEWLIVTWISDHEGGRQLYFSEEKISVTNGWDKTIKIMEMTYRLKSLKQKNLSMVELTQQHFTLNIWS